MILDVSKEPQCRVVSCEHLAFDEGWCKLHFRLYACHQYGDNTKDENPSAAAARCGLCGKKYDLDYDEWSKCPINLRRSLERAGVIGYRNA
jgi:hypothetical protein